MGLFSKLHDEGNTIVLVTHEADIATHADRIIHLLDGRISSDEYVTESDRMKARQLSQRQA
jgi:putative ABC transport system ATP-binding protein